MQIQFGNSFYDKDVKIKPRSMKSEFSAYSGKTHYFENLDSNVTTIQKLVERANGSTVESEKEASKEIQMRLGALVSVTAEAADQAHQDADRQHNDAVITHDLLRQIAMKGT